LKHVLIGSISSKQISLQFKSIGCQQGIKALTRVKNVNGNGKINLFPVFSLH
jgi:hypothetical protein